MALKVVAQVFAQKAARKRKCAHIIFEFEPKRWDFCQQDHWEKCKLGERYPNFEVISAEGNTDNTDGRRENLTQ